MKKNKMYLTTGEFAKLCHTTKHTLFHYCDIGLFSPVYTDENGYRYYHVLQYDTFLTITQLSTIGMSLSQIKSYMTERSPQRMVQLYSEQERSISEQIAQLQQIKERIGSQKENITQMLNCKTEYFAESQSKCWILCSDVLSPTDDYTMTTAIGDLIYAANGNTTANTLGMICSLKDAVEMENCPCRFYVGTTLSEQENCLAKPAGNYLTTYHRGEYETLQYTYQNLVSYANSRQIKLGEWIYAETIIGDWAVCSPQDYVIKVSAKIEKDKI